MARPLRSCKTSARTEQHKQNLKPYSKEYPMKKREKNWINMYRVVTVVLIQYQAVTNKIEELAEAVARFLKITQQVSLRSTQYQTHKKGVTAAKYGAEDTLIEWVNRIANALYVFGIKSNNEPIKARCRLTASTLRTLSDSELLQCSNCIAALAKENLENITGYGVSSENIGELDAAIESFSALLNEQQFRLSESKATREMLFEDFETANAILKEELDPLIETLKTTEEEFYNHYRASRTIKDLRRPSSKNGKTIEEPVATSETERPVLETTDVI